MRLFETMLGQLEELRHGALLSELAVARRREPVPESRGDGFLPPSEAAAAMGVDEAELADMARRGLLDWRDISGVVHVRPAIVSTLAVRRLA